MESYKQQLQLGLAKMRKLMNGHTVQLKHGDLGKGDVVQLGKDASIRIHHAFKSGRGVRLCMTEEERKHNAENNEDFKNVILSKQPKSKDLEIFLDSGDSGEKNH